jgi:FkbM family methyltransferase
MNFKKFVTDFIDLLYKVKITRRLFDRVVSMSMKREFNINYKGNDFVFTSPNSLNKWRLDTFSTKEPETLNWIDKLPSNSILWDIGANVGLYSVYAAKVRNCMVYSFEPSIFNLELLARNIFLNDLQRNISIVPLPLSNSIGLNILNMTSTEWGGAISTFGSEAIGHDGKLMDKIFEFRTLGISMAFAVEFLNIPVPDYIKMDVDGIEHLILMGGKNLLKSIKGVIIEINDDFVEQRETATKLLLDAGLKLEKKLHSEMIETMQEFKATFNQIWVR